MVVTSPDEPLKELATQISGNTANLKIEFHSLVLSAIKRGKDGEEMISSSNTFFWAERKEPKSYLP